MATINGKALVRDGKPLDRVYSNGQLVYSRNLIVRTGELDGKMIGLSGEIASLGGSSTVTPAIIKVTIGEPLTMSGTAAGDNYFRYAFYDMAGKTLMRSVTDLRSATTVIAPAKATTFRISYQKEAQVKLERGNVPTDWTPAPEDVQSDISKRAIDTSVVHNTGNETVAGNKNI